MYDYNYFINDYKYSYVLSKEEVFFLLEQIQSGDEMARKKLIQHNIGLVFYEVFGRFKNVAYDKNDLISIGNIGLIKAVESFDIKKGINFSTYAVKCIDNEIFSFIKKIRNDKKITIESFEMTVRYEQDEYECELKLGDIINDDTDIEKDYIDNEIYEFIRQTVEKLPERDKKIIMMYFGFNDDIIYTQTEIAKNLSISQARVSKIIIKNLKKIGMLLQQNGLIELKEKNKKKTKESNELKNKVKVLK